MTKRVVGRLTGRTVLITGGGSGIGLALAKHLIQQNNTVIITGRTLEKLDAAVQETPTLRAFAVDVGEPESVRRLFSDLQAANLQIDTLINNAGLYDTWPTLRTDHDLTAISSMVRTNAAGPVLMFQAFMQQANPARLNMIVNVSSEVAVFPAAPVALYAATKAALRSFTQSMRVLADDTNFHIVEVLPPTVNTQMTAHQPNAKNAMGPDQFAARVIADLEAGKTELAYGINVRLMTVFARFMPNLGMKLVNTLARQQIGFS